MSEDRDIGEHDARYFFVEAARPADLARQVSLLMPEGWEPLGGPMASALGLAQAVWKPVVGPGATRDAIVSLQQEIAELRKALDARHD